MPPFTSLHNRINLDAEWRRDYYASIDKARIVAHAAPLVHVLGPSVRPAELLLSDHPHLLPTDESRGLTNAHQAEDELGLCRSVYFYGGRAYPLAGGVAIVLSKESEANHTGSATPFDTGGWFRGRIRSNLSDDVGTRRAFCVECMINIGAWRDRFAEYLAAYFTPIDVYWSEGPPTRPDPQGVFQKLGNTWRAWTFEVRFCESHTIMDAQGWCPSERQFEIYTRQMLVAPPSHHDVLEQFLERAIKPEDDDLLAGELHFLNVVEEWIVKTIEIRL